VGLTRTDGVTVATTREAASGRKRVSVDSLEHPRITDAVGAWLAVAFLPTDLGLVLEGA
jgi:hypothetical protein